MGVRQVKSSGGNVIGTFPSLKMREQIPYESTIERDLLFFLEYDTNVVRYQAQPFVITGSSADGTARSYIPDFQIIRTDSKEIVECKPTAHLNEAHSQRQLALGQVWANANQHLFVVITDTDLRTGHRLANLKLLWRYSRLCVPPSITSRCRSILIAQADGLSLEALATALSNTSSSFELLPYLYHLLFKHFLHTDLTQPLSLRTGVQLQLPISPF
jgi:TnsA-like endonuclease N terminal